MDFCGDACPNAKPNRIILKKIASAGSGQVVRLRLVGAVWNLL
jgi:hypothetical protein